MSTTTTHSIFDTVFSKDSLSTLKQAIEAADIGIALKGEGPLTIFAPTNQAFEQIPKDTLDAVLQDKPRLQSILKFHVVPGKHMSDDIMKHESLDTLEGGSLKVCTEEGCRINDASVIQADIQCTNGVVHLIDTVLMPE